MREQVTYSWDSPDRQWGVVIFDYNKWIVVHYGVIECKFIVYD